MSGAKQSNRKKYVMNTFLEKIPLTAQMQKLGVEFDQQLLHAFKISASKPNISPEDTGFPDSYVTLALYRSNSILTRLVKLQEDNYNLFQEYKLAPKCTFNDIKPGRKLCRVLDNALKLAHPSNIIGVGHYLRAIVDQTLYDNIDMEFMGASIHNNFSIEVILKGLGYSPWTDLDKTPEVKYILKGLKNRNPISDFNYLLTTEKNRLIFRPTSILDSFQMSTRLKKVDRSLAVLTHLKDQYGGFLDSEILEFEDLINNSKSNENDIQKFLENHPHFFRNWNFREVYSQVYLTRDDYGPLIPDFLLIDRELQKSMILDLKLPTKKIVIDKFNRTKFSSTFEEGKAQLLEYRDWFEDSRNRLKIKEKYDFEVYRPNLAVVIGRKSDFTYELSRQKLQSREKDVELYTYYDISEIARRRIMLIKNS
jgi:hypothetical protein